MRCMILIKANKETEAGVLPDEKLLTEMGKYNEELVKAGIMLAGEGLHPSSKGARVKFSGGKRTVIDGPFTETKELIAGFWLWQVRSLEEAIEWVKRCPNPTGVGRDRDSPGVRGGRLRCRVHARAQGAGGAPARADRETKGVLTPYSRHARVRGAPLSSFRFFWNDRLGRTLYFLMDAPIPTRLYFHCTYTIATIDSAVQNVPRGTLEKSPLGGGLFELRISRPGNSCCTF